MPLILGSGKPAAIPVPLRGGAVWNIRPATSIEIAVASANAARVAAGLAIGQDAVGTAVTLLGEEFAGGDLESREWVTALSQRLILVELALLCSEGWTGMLDTKRRKLPLDKGSVALALRDFAIAQAVSNAINASIYLEIADEKKSRASLTGGAETGEATAPTAATPANPAPKAAASTESSARKSNSRRRAPRESR